MRVVRKLDEYKWRNAINENPKSNIFHTPEMFEVYDRAIGYKPSLFAVINNDGNVLSLMVPVQVSMGTGIIHFLSNRAIAYGSILYSPSTEGNQRRPGLRHIKRQASIRHSWPASGPGPAKATSALGPVLGTCRLAPRPQHRPDPQSS